MMRQVDPVEDHCDFDSVHENVRVTSIATKTFVISQHKMFQKKKSLAETNPPIWRFKNASKRCKRFLRRKITGTVRLHRRLENLLSVYVN